MAVLARSPSSQRYQPRTYSLGGLAGRATLWETTSCTVVACQPPSLFGFDVTVGPIKVANWSYSIAPHAGGSTVTETWTDQRGWLAKKLGGPASGVSDRIAHNRAGMEETLRKLAAHVES